MPEPKERTSIKVQAERAVLAAVRLPDSTFNHDDPFGELASLAEQAGAVVVGTLEQFMNAPVAGTYMGTGKVKELGALCDTLDASVILFDHELSPKQIGKIEEATNRKVLDRSELILDIFASRATTHEAKLQVELAQLEYTYPRLKAMWSHLERIVGGAPAGIGTRGPGEQQLEIDRRLVQRKRNILQRELREIQQRKARTVQARKVDNFTVGLVGYTNAGKSTLFNTLTTGGAYADDRVFATLMTRTREWDLGGGNTVMLSDTVGFVRDLPHNLVASFKATLEEATHADLLLIVLDAADPAAQMHYDTVMHTLDDLFAAAHTEARRNDTEFVEPERVLLLNKADQLRDRSSLLAWQRDVPGSVPLCALPGTEQGPKQSTETLPRLGGTALVEAVTRASLGHIAEYHLDVPLSESRTVHVIESRGEVLGRAYEGDRVQLRARLGSRQLAQLRAAGTQMTITPIADDGKACLAALDPKRGWRESEEGI